jgi:hypothetical protein
MAKVDSLQHQMHQNIQNELKNIETAEAIQEKSQECLEMAKIFKKRTSKLKWNTSWYKDNRGMFVGTVVVLQSGWWSRRLFDWRTCWSRRPLCWYLWVSQQM